MDYSKYISPHSSRRGPAITRELTKLHYVIAPDAISLAEGMPNASTFPISEIEVTLKDGERLVLKDEELEKALNYIPTQGYPPLLKLLEDFQQRVHNPPCWSDSQIMVTSGSQCGLSKTLEMVIVNGDPIILPDPIYIGAEIVLRPFQPEYINIPQDEFGALPHVLRSTLEERARKKLTDSSIRMPKLFYVNPTGSNPNGITMTVERKKEIYDICCQYDLLILEDDPYCFMHYLDKMPPSLLSMDTEGRVVRFDSFSKVLSSGIRLGWMTGPKRLVYQVELHIQCSHLHGSTLSQVLTYKLMQQWGFEKLWQHFDVVRKAYKVRRDMALRFADKYLTGLCEWTVPSAGMFLWIRILGVYDIYDMVTRKAMEHNLILAPGQAFMGDQSQPCQFIRVSYSKSSGEHMEEAFKVLAKLIVEERKLQIPGKIKNKENQ